MKKTIRTLATLLIASATITWMASCSNDDRPVDVNPQDETPDQPSQQKRVSQMATYLLKGGERLLKCIDQCTYDNQGRIVEWKHFDYSTGEALLRLWAELSYSDSQIYTVSKLASYSDAPASVERVEMRVEMRVEKLL